MCGLTDKRLTPTGFLCLEIIFSKCYTLIITFSKETL